MICAQCKAEGRTSTVYGGGPSMSTLMCEHTYWDEQGRFHRHDPNITTNTYSCSNGHRWTELTTMKCQSCDFGHVASTPALWRFWRVYPAFAGGLARLT